MSFVCRDPFARAEMHRIIVPKKECAWCGKFGAKFKYVVRTDDGRTISDRTPLSGVLKSGPFCSVDC